MDFYLFYIKTLSFVQNKLNDAFYSLTGEGVFREVVNDNLLHISPVKRNAQNQKVVDGLAKTYEIFSGQLYLQGVWKNGHKIGLWQYYAQGVREMHNDAGHLLEYWKTDKTGETHIVFPDPDGNGVYFETRTGPENYLYRRKYACKNNKPFGVGVTFTRHGTVLTPMIIIDITLPSGKVIFHDISKLPDNLADEVISRWETFFKKFLTLAQNPDAKNMLLKEADLLLGPARDQLQNAFSED